MKNELLSQEQKMLQIREYTDSIQIMSNDQTGHSYFCNPIQKITDNAIAINLRFSDKLLWIPKSQIILIDRKEGSQGGGLMYQICLPEWYLLKYNIK